MQTVTVCFKKARKMVAKNSRRRMTKTKRLHLRADRRASKNAVAQGDFEFQRKSITSWDVT
jgi:hypothetical protein